MKLLNTLATLGVASGILASARICINTLEQLCCGGAIWHSCPDGVENGIVNIQKLGGRPIR